MVVLGIQIVMNLFMDPFWRPVQEMVRRWVGLQWEQQQSGGPGGSYSFSSPYSYSSSIPLHHMQFHGERCVSASNCGLGLAVAAGAQLACAHAQVLCRSYIVSPTEVHKYTSVGCQQFNANSLSLSSLQAPAGTPSFEAALVNEEFFVDWCGILIPE